MNITRRKAAQAIAGAFALSAVDGIARAADRPSAKVAIFPIEPACQPFYAEANGFFTKAGIDVEVAALSTGAAILQAMIAGSYDIGNATITTLALAHSKGLPFVIIAPQGIIEKGKIQGGIFVPPNSPIKGPRDLEGKTLAISGLGTIAEYLPRTWVDKNGGDSTTIKFVEVPFPAIGDTIAAGRADAGWLNEPFFTIAVKKGQVKLLTAGDDVIAPTYLATAWVATAAWAKAHADTVSRFARAMSDAASWANANPDKVVPIVASKLKQDADLVAQVHRATFATRLVDAQIQPSIDVVAKYQKIPPFPASELIFRG
jgi:NitT/TauT family transport system substrate-binding protein